MNTNANVFEDNVKKALECADNVINSVNASLANASSSPATNASSSPATNVLSPATNVLPPEKNVRALLDDLELAAVAPTKASLNEPTIKGMGEEVQNIMSEGFNEFKRQTGRNMTYSEMRYAYG